jgi:predicted ester cyclase
MKIGDRISFDVSGHLDVPETGKIINILPNGVLVVFCDNSYWDFRHGRAADVRKVWPEYAVVCKDSATAQRSFADADGCASQGGEA